MTDPANTQYMRAKHGLAQFLSNIPEFQQAPNRQIVMRLMETYDYSLPGKQEGQTHFAYCYSLAEIAADQAGALKRLALALLDIERSSLVLEFRSEVDKLLPSEIFTLAERFQFIEDVSQYIPASEYSSYYELAKGEISRISLTTGADLVDQLEQLPPRKKFCHPLVMLSEKIAQKTADQDIEAVARRWANLIAMRIDDSEHSASGATEQEKLETLRQAQGSEPELSPQRVTLVQVVEPSGENHEIYLFSVLLYLDHSGPETIFSSEYPLALDQIRDTLISILRQVIERIPLNDPPTEIDLEFFLPRTLLHIDIENWTTRPGAAHLTLGAQYVVLLRDLDRWRDPTLWPAWRRKWSTLSGNGSGPEEFDAQVHQQWITCLDEPHRPGAFWRTLSEQQVSLGLTFPPPPRAPRAELTDALDAGLPVAFWPRRLCAHPVGFSPDAGQDCIGARFKETVDARLDGRVLTDLPEIILRMRKEQDPQDESCPGFALLWDDPRRVPSPSDFHLDKPGDLGES